MIWRLRARRDFSRLSAEGTRARAGVLWCTYLLDSPEPSGQPEDPARPSTPPRVAFAIGRTVGPAVDRNTVRRRLRALLTDPTTGSLPPGMYLIGATPAAVKRSSSELQFDLQHLIRKITS